MGNTCDSLHAEYPLQYVNPFAVDFDCLHSPMNAITTNPTHPDARIHTAVFTTYVGTSASPANANRYVTVELTAIKNSETLIAKQAARTLTFGYFHVTGIRRIANMTNPITNIYPRVKAIPNVGTLALISSDLICILKDASITA